MAYSNATFYLDFESGSDATRSTLNIVSSTNATPIELTIVAHGQVTGAIVTVASHLVNTNANGTWKITSTGANTLTLDTSAGNGVGGATGTAVPFGGSSKADAWKTVTSGATAARIAPGDTVRVMMSTDPTLVDSSTVWTTNSKTVTLSGAVTLDISTCETAWTASANVTCTTSSTRKEGSLSVSHAIASGFTTGKAAYIATGTLDLSAYQQVSFWVQCTNNTVAASTLSLRLCTDTVGDVSVHTVAIPNIVASGQWQPVTVDLATNMNSAIASIALYADLDPGTSTILIDNVIACKAAATASALSLVSLIGKVHNLSWVASTTYASNDIRIPTSPNRNGYRYKVTAGGGGSAGGTEPTWPYGIGTTVTDGALTWTCDELEDTWYPIQSIRGVTVLIDNGTNTAANAGRGYPGTSETVASYRREPISRTAIASALTASDAVQDSGTDVSPIVFIGGWNRTDMTTQTGQTWTDGHNGHGIAYTSNGKSYVTLNSLNAVRFNVFSRDGTNGTYILNCHGVGLTGYGRDNNGDVTIATIENCNFNNNQYGVIMNNHANLKIIRTTMNSWTAGGFFINSGSYYATGRFLDVVIKNGAGSALSLSNLSDITLTNLRTASSTGTPIAFTSNGPNNVKMINCSIGEGTEFQSTLAFGSQYIRSQTHDQTSGNHLITTDGGTIISATDQRHTASGISWKFRPTSTNRSSAYPLVLSVAKIKCSSGVGKSLTIWVRCDNANIKGRLIVEGGQIAGVANDVSVLCAPSINTWTQSSALTFTPTEDGAVEVKFYCWDGVGTTNNLWIDDFSD